MYKNIESIETIILYKQRGAYFIVWVDFSHRQIAWKHAFLSMPFSSAARENICWNHCIVLFRFFDFRLSKDVIKIESFFPASFYEWIESFFPLCDTGANFDVLILRKLLYCDKIVISNYLNESKTEREAREGGKIW